MLVGMTYAGVSYAAPDWADLEAAEQQVLQRHADVWDEMPDERRDRLAGGRQTLEVDEPAAAQGRTETIQALEIAVA